MAASPVNKEGIATVSRNLSRGVMVNRVDSTAVMGLHLHQGGGNDYGRQIWGP